MISQLLDFILHINDHLAAMVQQYGTQVYGILFLIIFVETGLVVMPFLPGDSLLFVLGALAAAKTLSIGLLWVFLTVAAVLGNMLNYWIGVGMADVINHADQKLIKPAHLKRTQEFFEHYGPKAIIYTRFLPILRTIAPFLAGVGKMDYQRFALYNLAGGFLWVTIGWTDGCSR